MRAFYFMFALLLAGPALAARAPLQTVAAERIAAVARAVMSSDASKADITIDSRVIGMPADAVVPAGKLALHADRPEGRWPRSRVAVLVRILVNGVVVRTEPVWFAVTAMRSTWVYARDAAQGTPSRSIKARLASINIASEQGHPVALNALAGERLKRGMQAGRAIVSEDFEPIPDVDARQKVVMLLNLGAIKLQTSGTALNAGNAGESVSVLAEGAESPVEATVQSKGVVDVAR